MEPGSTEEEEVDAVGMVESKKQYYSKRRTPMRKLPALIQYWIDTGNPPYQLHGNDEHSETGSSLSENDHSRSGRSAVFKKSKELIKHDEISPCSSVDTAAYIRSNANVTKKSETLAIVEGARITASSPVKSLTNSTPSPTKTPLKMSTPLKNIIVDADSLNQSLLSHGSVRLSGVVPVLKQFSEISEETHASPTSPMKPPPITPSKRLSLRLFPRKPKITSSLPYDSSQNSSQNLSQTTSQNSSQPSSQNLSQSTTQKISLINGAYQRPLHRRKLYTGRNSPVDLSVIPTTSNEATILLQDILHPALQPVAPARAKLALFASRARARRKRKRMQGVASQSGNTSRDSDDGSRKVKKKGDMRYSDFFESLGLTPSKTIIGKGSVKKPLTKRSRKSESEKKETTAESDGEDIAIKEMKNSAQTTEDASTDKIGTICCEKILKVRIEKLPKEILARCTKQNMIRDSGNVSCDSSSSRRVGSLKNIELLTTMTHDSDSSTIIICSCSKRPSASDSSLISKNRKDKKAKSGAGKMEHTSPAKMNASPPRNFVWSNKSKKTMPKVFVCVEKLPMENLSKKLSSSKKSSRSNGRYNFFGSSSDSSSEDFRETCFVSSKKLDKPIALSLRSSLGMSVSSDDEDGFVKLVNEFDDVSGLNDPEGDSKTKSSQKTQRTLAISASSDEDDFVNDIKNVRLANGDEAVRLNNRKDESNRRKIKEYDEERIKDLRRSSRNKCQPTWGEKYQNIPITSPSRKPKHIRNLFTKSHESNLTNEEGKTKIQESLGVQEKLKTGFTVNKTEIVGNLTRFRTRLDSDSDSDFDGVKFSINENYKSTKVPPENSKISSLNLKKISPEKTQLRMSPRRSSFKNLEECHAINERKSRVRTKISPLDIFNTDERRKERIPMPNEFVAEELHGTNKNVRESALSKHLQKKRRSLRNSTMSKESKPKKKASSTKLTSKSESRRAAKRPSRRITIIGTPMDYETDDDSNLITNIKANDAKVIVSSISLNDKNPETPNDKNSINDFRMSKNRRDTKNLFLNSFDDTIEDIDLLFNNNEKSPVIKASTVTFDKLDSLSTGKSANLIKPRQSTMTFRTRFRCESDDEGDVL